jgi:hypothetical protein
MMLIITQEVEFGRVKNENGEKVTAGAGLILLRYMNYMRERLGK